MGEKKIKMCQKKDESIKKVLEEIEDKAIESRYTNMYDWQRRELSKEDLFEYAEEMRIENNRIKRTPRVYSNLC